LVEKMKSRPILFSAPMVLAILDGRKTQTRRVLKGTTEHKGPYNPEYIEAHKNSDGWSKICPYGKVGDRLWVRETFMHCGCEDAEMHADSGCDLILYRASEPNDLKVFEGWRPSIHMPRWASRITLEITDVRVERLNDITVSDAIAEGYDGSVNDPVDPSIKWYSRLWDRINVAGAWELNPWVWVIEFKRVEK
jgi:hypothetical protein